MTKWRLLDGGTPHPAAAPGSGPRARGRAQAAGPPRHGRRDRGRSVERDGQGYSFVTRLNQHVTLSHRCNVPPHLEHDRHLAARLAAAQRQHGLQGVQRPKQHLSRGGALQGREREGEGMRVAEPSQQPGRLPALRKWMPRLLPSIMTQPQTDHPSPDDHTPPSRLRRGGTSISQASRRTHTPRPKS